MSTSTRTVVPIEEELTPQQIETFRVGKQLKETGDELFRTDPKEALRNYHGSLFHFRGLTRHNPAAPDAHGQELKPKSELDEVTEKVYSNMSACLLKLCKYERTIQAADQALALNKENYKALFRKGKALGELGFFEKAEDILKDLLTKNPAEAPTIKTELESLRAKDKARERERDQSLRGFLKGKDIFGDAVPGARLLSDGQPTSASIEEITSE